MNGCGGGGNITWLFFFRNEKSSNFNILSVISMSYNTACVYVSD